MSDTKNWSTVPTIQNKWIAIIIIYLYAYMESIKLKG